MTTNRDPEETRRLTMFVRYVADNLPCALVDNICSGLEEIEKRSKELLERGRATQSVDKGKDSGDVAKLVERFQEAIAWYQISQQQATYDGITNLASSFNTLLKLQEKSPAVKNKLDSVIARLDRLEDSGNDKEHECWAKLFDTLRLIKDNGNALYNRINAQDYQECEEDIKAASGIAEDIRDALLNYQVGDRNVGKLD
jgi:hypothetical protein